MAHIRLATVDDLPEIVRMARAFIAYGKRDMLRHVDDDVLHERARMLMESDTITVFVADAGERGLVGMIVGTLIGVWFAPTQRIATELAWWVDEDARGTPTAIRLVMRYEQWAREHGAQVATMSSLVLDSGSGVGTMLGRMGFAPSEVTHVKEI